MEVEQLSPELRRLFYLLPQTRLFYPQVGNESGPILIDVFWDEVELMIMSGMVIMIPEVIKDKNEYKKRRDLEERR